MYLKMSSGKWRPFCLGLNVSTSVLHPHTWGFNADPAEVKKHDDVIKWKHFPRYWPFVRGIHRSPVNSPHKGQWRGALMFSLMCAELNVWVNTREAGDLKRYRIHYDVIVMIYSFVIFAQFLRQTLVRMRVKQIITPYGKGTSVLMCANL